MKKKILKQNVFFNIQNILDLVDYHDHHQYPHIFMHSHTNYPDTVLIVS